MNFNFLQQQTEKPKMEVGKKYLLYREFLNPIQLDALDDQGWELIAIASSGNKLGYYFRKNETAKKG